MARVVARHVTVAPPRRKPADMVDPTKKGKCGWCLTGMHEQCVYLRAFPMNCPCDCNI